MIRIYGSGNPVSEAEIDRLERDLDHILPEDYRKFLLEHNGGFVDPDSFTYLEDGRERTGGINRFFSINDSTCYHPYQRRTTYLENPRNCRQHKTDCHRQGDIHASSNTHTLYNEKI